MSGNTCQKNRQVEPNLWETADKLGAIRWLTISESQHAAMSSKSDRQSRNETTPGNIF